MNRSLIRCEEVSFSYPSSSADARNRPTIDGLHLDIGVGEFVACAGENGSGKSTLAKLLAGLLTPDAGRVWVDGRPTDAGSPETRRGNTLDVGLVFQNPDNQLVGNTVEEDIAFGPENLGLDSREIERRVREAMEAVGLGEELRTRAPSRLSGGQKQRVAVAGMLALRPRCLVLDEATSMLDPEGRDDVFRLLHELNGSRGLSVFWITHRMEEALLSDRLVFLDRGKKVFDGSPRRFLQKGASLGETGLELPFASQVARRLRELGLPVPDDVFTVDELVYALCRS